MAEAKSKLDIYAHNQRTQYDTTSLDRTQAEKQVGPGYENLRKSAPSYIKMMLQQYSLLRAHDLKGADADIRNLSFLDFGCGVGRVMEALVEMGAPKVDGADISEVMLNHARNSEYLSNSQFFLTNGYNAGEAPENSYDIAYSFLCIHHIPMRQTRIRILEALCKSLKTNGMCFIELQLYPGIDSTKVPRNHAAWDENKPAQYTNSRCDVWLTPDSIGKLYQDVSLFFQDFFLIEAENGANHYEFNPEARYQYAPNKIFVGGVKKAALIHFLKTTAY